MEDEPVSTPAPETPGLYPTPEEEALAIKPARSKKWFIIGGALVVFLSLAAFLGMRLLKPQANTELPGRGQMSFSSKGKSVRLSLTPAEELPQQEADTAGLFVRREDQSIFIGTGRISMRAAAGPGGSSVSSGYDGPVVEVVTSHDTRIYQDITDMTPSETDLNKGGEVKIQQVIKPGSLEDLGANSMVSVWGDKQGDRYVARVITFR